MSTGSTGRRQHPTALNDAALASEEFISFSACNLDESPTARIMHTTSRCRHAASTLTAGAFLGSVGVEVEGDVGFASWLACCSPMMTRSSVV